MKKFRGIHLRVSLLQDWYVTNFKARIASKLNVENFLKDVFVYHDCDNK